MSDNLPNISNRWFRKKLAPLFLLLLVLGCDSPAAKEAQFFKRGVALYEQGEDAKAMLEFRNVLRLNPKNADALYHVGLIQERAQQLPQAYAAFQAATAEKPDMLPAQVKRGMLAIASGELDSAEAAADAIEKVEPTNADGLAIRAAVMLRRGDLQRAFDAAGQALAKNPNQTNALAVQVGVLHARGRTDEAIALIDQSLSRLPKSVSLLLLKLTLLEQRNDVDGVTRAYEELTKLDPTNVSYQLAMADFYQRHNDPAGAETTLRGMMEHGLRTTQVTSALIGLVHREKGFAAAESELKRLIAQTPDDQQLKLLLADLYLQEKQTAQAEATLQAIVKDSAETDTGDDARVRLARIRLQAGDATVAGKLADEVLARNAQHRGALLVKGIIAFQAKDLDESLRQARAALRDDPNWLPALRLLVEVYLAKNERDLASDALSTIVKLDPTDTTSAERLAELLTERGDLDGALKVWDQVTQRASDPTPALRARAGGAIRQGNWMAAEADIARLSQSPGQEAAVAMLAGNLSFARQRYDEGREWFLKAETLRPDEPGPMTGIVYAYLAKGDEDGALAFLRERAAARPDDAVALQLTGALLARAGKPAEAETAYREAIRRQPSWVAPYRQLGALLVRSGAPDRAADLYQAALKAVPDTPALLLDLGDAQFASRHPDAAIETFRHALTVDPGSDRAANNVAALVADYRYQDQAELDRAIDLAQRFRASEDPNFLDTLGWLYYRKGDYPVALTLLQRATAYGAGGPQFHYHLGMALYRGGDQDAAAKELGQAVVDGADYPGLDEAKAKHAELAAARPNAPGG